MNLLPGTPDGQGGSSVRIITESTNGADPATSYINVPIGNPGTGAGQIQMSILGRNIDGEGKVSAPKMTIPPIPVPSFGAICFQQSGPGTGTVDCNGDTGEAAPDPLDYRTLQDHVTNNPGSQPAEDPQCQFGCREGSVLPGAVHTASEPGVWTMHAAAGRVRRRPAPGPRLPVRHAVSRTACRDRSDHRNGPHAGRV